MANIFVRSPYIVSINETGQIETKVELFIWNGLLSAVPTSPTYTLSKLIPAPTQTLTTYNISSYVREFISHASFTNQYISNNILSYSETCNVQIKRYYKTTTTFTLIDTVTHRAFDGYSLYTEGYNKDLGNQLLKGGKTYYYLYKSVADGNLINYPLYRPGDLTIYIQVGEKIRWTNLRTGTQLTFTAAETIIRVFARVREANYADGNLFEHLTSANAVLWSATFKPKTECKYEPVCCDFINRYGAWQREYFFKASKSNIEVQNTEYNLLQNTLVNFDVLEGQRKTFNTNYAERVTVNTDWVTEDFSDNLRELMTSERILIDNRPAKLNSKSMELQKHVNTKMINYTLEFEFATDIINNVI
jgi:hypothetical protein